MDSITNDTKEKKRLKQLLSNINVHIARRSLRGKLIETNTKILIKQSSQESGYVQTEIVQQDSAVQMTVIAALSISLYMSSKKLQRRPRAGEMKQHYQRSDLALRTSHSNYSKYPYRTKDWITIIMFSQLPFFYYLSQRTEKKDAWLWRTKGSETTQRTWFLELWEIWWWGVMDLLNELIHGAVVSVWISSISSKL